ncbi:3'(2'),5'-bisphosphate nucleotidase CysQ [Aestuariivirga sp.]|uniref:3'(2'),5'-bisphosphate nucleotidase CysQ n=1 Tax=Aestuariivirga sp. TaxID=2650926 RepID=UPI0037847433
MRGSDNLDHDAALLLETVRAAGELGLALARKPDLQRWTKPDGTPVTEGDLAIDQLIQSRLRSARPGDGVLSEETPDGPDRLGCHRLWIVDPIDGTRAFSEGRTEWCVAAALVVAGRPVLASVFQPITGDVFLARAGEGSTLNGAPLAMADPPTLEGARIAGSRKALAQLSPAGVSGDSSGALPLQLRLAAVAAGRLDGAVSLGPRNDWDLAAGELLVIEAGGTVSSTDGRRYVYNQAEPWQQGLVAAGARRHAALITALRTSGP